VAQGETFFDLFKRSVERSRASREVRAAVRSRSRGKSRDEARQILVDEIRAHGQEVPAQPWLDARLDGILASDNPVDRAKVTVEAVSALGDLGVKMFKMFKTHTVEEDSNDPGFDETWMGFFPQEMHQSVEIELDDDVQGWIGHVDEETSFQFQNLGSLRLTLHLSPSGTVVAHVGDRRAGVLNDTDAEVFRPCFSAFGKERHALLARGSRYRTPDGRWHVYVNPPEEHFLRLLGLDIEPGEDLPPEAMRQLVVEPIPPTPSGRLRYDRQKRRWVDGSDLG
jgi:hypothetical protein